MLAVHEQYTTGILCDQCIQLLPDFPETVPCCSCDVRFMHGCIRIAVGKQDDAFVAMPVCNAEKPVKPIAVGDNTILEFIVSSCSSEVVIVLGRHMQCGEQDSIFKPVCIFRIIGEAASQ